MEEYSRGCESGWTVYFEQSRAYASDDGCANRSSSAEDEDLSMVSDASSGPAQQVSQDDRATRNCYMSNNNGGRMFIRSVSTDEDAALGKKPRRRGRRAGRGGKAPDGDNDQQQLDDTASSRPDFNYNCLLSIVTNFAQDHFSASYFQAGASSTSMNARCDQVHSHQPYHWC